MDDTRIDGVEPPSSDRWMTESRVAEWSRLAREDPDRLGRELEGLPFAVQAQVAALLTPSERLALLTHAPKPMRVVRTLSGGDFHLTVRDVGPLDALPLIALGSADQIQHLFDLEGWRGNRLDPERAGAWTAVFLEADEPTLRRFLRNADEEILALLFRTWARVEQIEYDDQVPIDGAGESEAGNERGFVSPDGYFRFSPSRPEHVPAVRRMAELLFLEHPERYQRAVWAALNELPSELEESALHWRNSRLEEHGYPPREESLSIYAPPEPRGTAYAPPLDVAVSDAHGSRLAVSRIEDRGLLSAATRLLSPRHREALLAHLLALSHRVLVADLGDTGDPDTHRASLDKAATFVGIGLERRGGADPGTAAAALEEIPLIELFREGWSVAADLQHRARTLVSSGWASAAPDALDLMDSPIRQRVSGLLEPRPLYFELPDDEGNPRFREFRTVEEMDETRRALDLARAVGHVMVERLGVDVSRVLRDHTGREHPPLFSTLLLTLMAWNVASGELRLEPLPPDVVADFLRDTASRRTASPDAPARAMGDLVDRLTEALGLDPGLAASLLAFGGACLEKLRKECSGLDPGVPVTGRDVSCLLLENGSGVARDR
jgi:hypothetical protein